jgi:anion-transporting  ArsA/GET3 family ATPase
LAIDPELALLEYLEMFYNLKRAAQVLRRMGAIDFATTLAPGVRDVLLTGKVKETTNRTDKAGRFIYSAVVLDAPPTGRIRPFLDATTEVANLTKAGPINRQSVGVLELLHSTRTAVHLVTLLEEMPVQETVDAAGDLVASGFHLGAVIVNRARPTLVAEGQVSPDGRVDVARLARGLAGTGIGAGLAEPLAGQLVEYADRQHVQAENRARLDVVEAPRIELPDLTPPVDLGELNELAAYFQDAP